MRGTDDKALFDKFVAAVIGFPPTARDGKSAKEVFAESFQLLSDLASQKKPFPRALAWKGYALALSVYEGWPLPDSAPEKKMLVKDLLDMAQSLASEAIALDTTDHDLHWAMADIHLIRKEFTEANDEFAIALYLNRDERHPNLFVEAASAMTQIGDLDSAQKHFRKATRGPDWHRWMKGIMLFIQAGRAGANEETFLNLAMDELTDTHAQPGDDFYQLEIQLVLAAVHWRKAMLLWDKAAAAPDQASRDLLERYAQRNQTAAKRAIQQFRATFDYWTVDQARTALPFQVKDDSDYWVKTVGAVWNL